MKWITKHSSMFLLTAGICLSSFILFTFFNYSLVQVMFRATVLFVVVFAVYNNPWLQKHYTEYKNAVKVEKNHWKNDKDLQFIQKIRYGLWLVCFGCLVYGVFTMQNLDGEVVYECVQKGMFAHEIYAEGYSFIKAAYCVFVVNLLIHFVCNVHIALFRNPITPGVVKKICIDCARIGAAFTGGWAISQITADQMAHSEVNDVANVYNSVSPTGRGYGYSSTGAKELDRELQSLQSYNSLDHVKTTPGRVYTYKEIDHESMKKWAIDNRKDVRSNISFVNRQRHNLP